MSLLTDTREKVAKAFVRFRTEKGMTQKELAERLYVSQGYISKIESQTLDLPYYLWLRFKEILK